MNAAIPLAEWRGSSGRDVLAAYVLGFEVEARVSLSVYPEHYDVGWHITGTGGTLGAAAASARLLGLDAEQTVWALGAAVTQAAGLREMFGSMCKSLHVGDAAATASWPRCSPARASRPPRSRSRAAAGSAPCSRRASAKRS